MQIGYIGLGKMGFNMVERLLDRGYEVVATDVDWGSVERVIARGAIGAKDNEELVAKLSQRRVVWMMVPHQFVDGVVGELLEQLDPGDIILDGGNSFFEDSLRRYRLCKEKGIGFLDVGTSGGPNGARDGACMMIGGDRETYLELETLFKDLSVSEGYAYVGNAGAGHFVKMVHNGIEYGMMQAIAEGFAVMRESSFGIELETVAKLFGRGSVIESRLVDWLLSGYQEYGVELSEISGEVAESGEAAWTVETAKKLNVPTPIIKGALDFRIASRGNPSYIGQVLSVMRNQFGGHQVKKDDK